MQEVLITSLLNSHYVILLHNLSFFFCFPNEDDINLRMQIIWNKSPLLILQMQFKWGTRKSSIFPG